MNIQNIMTLPGVKIAKYLPSNDLLEEVAKKINFRMGNLLSKYLSNCGYLEFSFVELFGVTQNKRLDSDMVTKTIFINEKFPQTAGYVVLEDKGDGDYILCDQEDGIFEFIPTLRPELVPLECDLFGYLISRYHEVQ